MPHQIQAVYGELLNRTPLRFLLADDPGAGKTIMAGLYIKEMMLRGDLERCLIVAPGGLVEQWQDELRDKFGLNFELLTREMVNADPDGNPFRRHHLLIARMDQLSRSEELQRHLDHTDWDLTVVDEAHRMAAHYFSSELKKTRRYLLGELLGRKSRHFLLMTATPHAGKEEDFQLFLALLDTDRFEGRYRDAVHTVSTEGLMRRMVKEDLKTFEGKPLFPERKAYTVGYELSGPEHDLYEAVIRYVREEMTNALTPGPVDGGAAIRVGSPDTASCDSVELPGLSVVDVHRMLTAIRTASDRKKLRAAQLREVLDEAGAAIWEPILDRWPDLRRAPLALVPVGDVSLLPLYTATLNGVPASASLDVVIAPSARALALAAGRPTASTEPSLVIVDPASDTPGLDAIPRTVTEAAQVAEIHGTRPVVLGGPAARTPRPDDLVNLISAAGLVHLACHGTIDGAPLSSALHLGEGIALQRIWERRLRAAPLVILSACHLGGIAADTPGEQLGFPAVLLAAGARAVIGALWAVSESPLTVGLMAGFHRRLHAGTPPSQALGDAIGAAAAAGVTPSAWGPFSYLGGGRG